MFIFYVKLTRGLLWIMNWDGHKRNRSEVYHRFLLHGLSKSMKVAGLGMDLNLGRLSRIRKSVQSNHCTTTFDSLWRTAYVPPRPGHIRVRLQVLTAVTRKRSSKTSLNIHQTTRCRIPEDNILQVHPCVNTFVCSFFSPRRILQNTNEMPNEDITISHLYLSVTPLSGHSVQ
jgi:hypothetical protein